MDRFIALIYCEIIKSKGKGFTLQIAPIVTNWGVYSVYTAPGKEKTMTWNQHIYGFLSNYNRDSDKKLVDSYLRQEIDIDYSIADEHGYRDWINQLPSGISFQETMPEMLVDTTNVPPESMLEIAVCAKGKRIFVSVSDEYASRIYSEIILTSANIFLEKHKDVWEKIISLLNYGCGLSDGMEFVINDELIRRSPYKFYKCLKHYYDSEDRIRPSTVKFSEVGMKPLQSMDQKIGMTFALIKTLLNNLNALSEYKMTLTVDHKLNICIDFLLPMEPQNNELKDW